MSSNPFKPTAGGVYRALKSNRQLGYKAGENYLYTAEGNLQRFTKRSVDVLLNGYNCLRQPGHFEPVALCPFCGDELFDLENWTELPGWRTPVHMHDAEPCATKWDAQVKGYCVECSADLENGACPKCTSKGR